MTWLRTIRMMLKGAIAAPTPAQVALAIALGIAVGIVPKGNLLCVGLGVVMCALRLNLPVALAVTVLVSMGAAVGDPLFDKVGGALLEADSLRPLWVWLSERPFSAWLQFNNTVVLGSFVIGVMQIYPMYRLTRPACEKLMPKLIAKIQGSFLLRLWARLEWSGRIGSASQS